jgi:hypothetical protein
MRWLLAAPATGTSESPRGRSVAGNRRCRRASSCPPGRAGLAEVSRELDRQFDALLRTEPLNYHLACIADIEATFTPLFSMFFAHKATMFDNGDPRVAPLW